MDDETLGQFSDRQTLRYVRIYPVPLERVWRAVTTSEALNVWLYPVSRVEQRLGGRCSFSWGKPEDPTLAGEVLRFEPRRCVRYGTPAGYIQFELEPVEGGTRFTFTQYFHPDFRHPDGEFADDDPSAALPAGPDTPWRPGFVAGFHLNFRQLGRFLEEDWPEAQLRDESARRVAIANAGGDRARLGAGPESDWRELVDVYTTHIRETCPPR